MILRVFTVLSFLFVANAAHAGDLVIDEVRLGGTVLDMRVIGAKQPHYEYQRAGLNAEVLLSPFDFDWRDGPSDGLIPDDLIRSFFTPRLHFGATVGLEKHTTSSVYSGFTWDLDLGETFFVESSFGFAVHDGNLERSPLANGKFKRGFGSRVLFRESFSVGAKLSPHINLIAQLTHMSHADLAGPTNAGQTDVALKIGYKF